MFFPFSTRISRSQAFQIYFSDEYSQIRHLAAGHLQALQHKHSRRWKLQPMLLFWPVSVGSLVLVYHVCGCFVTIEGSQIIAFLSYQLLTLPLRVDPFAPTPFSRLSNTVLNIIIIYCFHMALFSALEQTRIDSLCSCPM